MKRIDEEGPDAILQLREPVNRFPRFVRYAVQRLKTLCPSMGKVKIAQDHEAWPVQRSAQLPRHL